MSGWSDPTPQPDAFRSFRTLLDAEWAAGILGLRLFIACIAIAAFMMGTVWVLGGGLSAMLERGGTTFLGADVAVSTNVELDDELQGRLSDLGTLSRVAEFRSSAEMDGIRSPIELKAVDDLYPLYGTVELESGRAIDVVLGGQREDLPVIVEPTLLTRTGAAVGDVVRIGDTDFTIADVLVLEPDRLSAGRFMVGPRVLARLDHVVDSGLIQLGSIVDFRYRIKADGQSGAVIEAVRALRPEAGWEFETPSDAGDRVLRTVERTTTFLGIAGIVALTIGLSGAWAAARAWVQRRSRTIALYRLSGATPGMVFALHAAILLLASAVGLLLGLLAAVAAAWPMLDLVTARLHISWAMSDLIGQLGVVVLLLVTGLAGTGLLALSAAVGVSPGAAMRSGEAPLQADPRHTSIALALIVAAIVGAALSLPIALLAGAMSFGFLLIAVVLAAAAGALSWFITRRAPKSFSGTIICQSLAVPSQTATRTVAIGIGIVGITAIVATQSSLTQALTDQLPERVPDLVLIDVQPAQVEAIRTLVAEDPDLGGLQADPFMRMTITAVNGVPAEEALVREDKSWVIEGDRSFSWTATPTGAELLQGEWWAEDYTGPPLISPEEDVMEAFDLVVGDTMTYSVLGRSFTSEVVNIRMEYHRTFRPEHLMMASPQPFRNAPHTWVMSLQGKTQTSVDGLIRTLAQDHGNVTSIDIRPIVAQVKGVVEGASLAILGVAFLLVAAGALSVAALVASDVDARRREALVFSLIGASRREVAMIRLAEAASVGAIAAMVGGLGGLLGGYFIVTEGLRIEWAPSLFVFLVPVGLGVAASVVAGVIGGMGAAPKGSGQMVRLLTA